MMDVRFRTMPPDKLARQITPGQPQSGDEQNFLEVVESLTSSGQTPEQAGDTGGGRQESPLGSLSARTDSGHVEESENSGEESIEETAETFPDSSAPQPSDISDPDEPPIGARIDLIA